MMKRLARALGRLGVGRKLALIYLLDLTAVIFISGILINEKYIAINFARKELAGNAYIRELRQPLLHLAGNRHDAQQVMRDHDATLAAETRHGANLKSEGLSQAFAASLLHGGPQGDSEDESRAFQGGRRLITRVGNQSNLILDPDLDSYYTMSIVLLRYPELAEVVRGISLQVREQAALVRPWAVDARTQYFIFDGRLDATASNIESDVSEAIAASTGTLRDRLAPSQAAVTTRIEEFRRLARSTLDAEGTIPLADVLRARDQLLADLDGAWHLASLELDRPIQQRIDGFFSRMWLHLGTALAMLAVILSAVYFVARQISRPLANLAEVADRVRRDGDQGRRAVWRSQDEIGRLVVAFNGMLDQLRTERSLQEELTARTHVAAAQKTLVEALPIPLIVTSIPGHEVLHVNEPGAPWLNGRRTDPWAVGLDPKVRSRFFQQLADEGAVDEFEVQWKAGGEPVWAVLSARRLRYQDCDAILTAFTPINQLKSLEQRLELWAKVYEASSEGIVILGPDHRVISVNRALCRNTGFEAHDLVGEPLDVLVSHGAGAAFFARVWPTLDQRLSWQSEVNIARRDGSVYPAWLMLSAVRDPANRITHYIVTSLDITDRKATQERIHFLAHHDVLTGLPNRILCNERLRLAMQQAQRDGTRVAVLFIDLDRFKHINDSLGHHIGDALLRSVAQRLTQCVRDNDTVSRLGGDEFIVVLGQVESADEVARLAEQRLVPAIREKHDIAGAELHVSCSVGIAIFPDNASDLDELQRQADVAMYQAKARGRDQVSFFTPDLNDRAHKRLRLESLLRHAAAQGELSLNYQPRIDAQSGALMSVEALLRWHSPELGQVSPTEFIPIAEDSRLIVSVGLWAFREACRQNAQWRREGLGDIPISVNLSAIQLGEASIVGDLEAALREFEVDPGSIELELTESSLAESVDLTLLRLETLKSLGVTLVVDDFGTGYSSLNYLNRFPIDRLKVDRSFVKDMLVDTTAAAITRAVISLGHALSLRVVAEGVETHEIASSLRACGCDELQGYAFARPLPASGLAAWMQAHREQPITVS